jgi:aromatic amino acid aminotransferase I / 2-aminoadipate transaminase
VDWRKHPGVSRGMTHDSIEMAIFQAAVDRGVLVSRGSWFKADQSLVEETMFFRVTFAAAPADKITEAIRRFADALRAEFGL